MNIWEKLKEERVYKGYRNILKKTFRLPNQKIIDYDIVETYSFVSVAALTTDQQVILIEQYRPGPEKNMISVPEGQIDQQESPEATAYRELLEETGYQAEKMIFLKETPEAYSTSRKLCFLALNCQKIQEQRLDDAEFIRVFTMGLKEFENYIQNNQEKNFSSVDVGYLMLNYLQKLS